MNDKTVIVLGSGFSVSSLIPTQNDLLKKMDEYYSSTGCISNGKVYWLDFKKVFSDLIGNDITTYLIEDIFTILDKSIIDNESYKGMTSNKLREFHSCLMNSLRIYLIDTVNDTISKQKGSYKKYSELALKILHKRKMYQKKDRLSIVSLNWDNYFERTILNKLPNFKKVELDYCTYDNSFDSSGKAIPSVFKKAKEKINLKYLKPHGSINWGYCSNCGRLYISYGRKIETNFECIKYCNKIYKNFKLDPFMITPTFLKDLSNVHLKDIWSNLAIEISEATKIIFIGYSLRPEDFNFRYVLSKNVNKKCEVYVFDYVDIKRIPTERDLEKKSIENKFKSFFQNSKKVEVYIDGWESQISLINTLLP